MGGLCCSQRRAKASITDIPKTNALNPMDPQSLRLWGTEVVDLAAGYWDTMLERQPQPVVKPLELYNALPQSAPELPQSLVDVVNDTKELILPSSTNWHHPHFFAYYPTANSYPSIAGDILSGAIGSVGFSWSASPASTELEMVVTDWLARALGLPEHFLFSHSGPGGGIILGTASEAIHTALLVSRSRTLRIKKLANVDCHIEDLVSYASDQAHSCVERAALFGGVRHCSVQTDNCFSMTASSLRGAIQDDINMNLVPFFVCATLGTTAQCAFDHLEEIGEVCKEFGLWLHVDAANAGSAFICQEHRHYMKGIELADSFNFNPHKYKDTRIVEQSFRVDPVYLQYDRQDTVPDFRHWELHLGRRFRSLKVWYVLKAFGLEQVRTTIRNMIQLAFEFEALMKSNDMFEIVSPVGMGLVCFRIRGANNRTETLLALLNDDRRIHLVPAKLHDLFVLRLAIASTQTKLSDIRFAYSVICEVALKVEAHVTMRSNGYHN